MAKQNFKHVCFCMGASVMAILSALPSFGAVNPTIKKLLTEKKQKMAQLEQCAQKVKGFKIAGISTLGLTAVGIGGNIALATKNAKLEKTINGTDGLNSQIKDEQNKIASLDTKIAAEEQRVKDEKRKAEEEKAAKEEAARKAKEEAEQKAKEEAERKAKEDQLNKDKEDCAKKGKTWRWVEEEEKCKEKDPVVVLGQSCANPKNGIKTASYVKANSGATKCWKDKNKKKEEITPCYCKIDECNTDTHKLDKGKCVAMSDEEKARNSKDTVTVGQDCSKAFLISEHAEKGEFVAAGSNGKFNCYDANKKITTCNCKIEKCNESEGYKLNTNNNKCDYDASVKQTNEDKKCVDTYKEYVKKWENLSEKEPNKMERAKVLGPNYKLWPYQKDSLKYKDKFTDSYEGACGVLKNYNEFFKWYYNNLYDGLGKTQTVTILGVKYEGVPVFGYNGGLLCAQSFLKGGCADAGAPFSRACKGCDGTVKMKISTYNEFYSCEDYDETISGCTNIFGKFKTE